MYRTQNLSFTITMLLLIVCLHFGQCAVGAPVVDFEDLMLPSSGYLDAINGTPATGFTSGGVLFPWSDSFGFPVEFAASNIADTTDYLNDGDPSTQPYEHTYNSITGGGSDGSAQYAVANAFVPVTINLPASPVSIDVTNNTYAYYSMLSGDGFAKQFGGPTGDDPDYFVLTITGKNGGSTVGSIDVYLADFRATDNSLDFILNTWKTIDLTALAGSDQLQFSLDSSDFGTFGINTPAYFALDNVTVVPEPTSSILLIGGSFALMVIRKSLRARLATVPKRA